MKLNPVYTKELKISVRTVRMACIIFGYNFILALIGLFAFYLNFEEAIRYGNGNFSNIFSIYATISIIELGLILFIVPGFTASAISGERERQTLEILLTTKLSPMEIILGKLSSCISSMLLLVFSSLPILSIVFSVGGIGFLDLLQFMFLALVTAVFIGSIGIFFSTVFKRTTLATVFTYGMVVLLILGTVAIVMAVYMIISMQGTKEYMAEGVYKGPDVGNTLLILLINPLVTMVAMITEQFGGSQDFANMLKEYGNASAFAIRHWFVISVVTQIVLSIGFIKGAGQLLNPLRKKKRI